MQPRAASPRLPLVAVGIAACLYAAAAAREVQLLPAGEFAARDGRPGPGQKWRLDDAGGRAPVVRPVDGHGLVLRNARTCAGSRAGEASAAQASRHDKIGARRMCMSVRPLTARGWASYPDRLF